MNYFWYLSMVKTHAYTHGNNSDENNKIVPGYQLETKQNTA